MTETARNPLGTENIGKLLRQFAVPSVIAMLVSALYNMVDQLFIGHSIGMLGNAATNVAFPLTTVSTALALLCGIGGAANFNISMGRKDPEKARRYMGAAFPMLLTLGIVLCVVSRAFLEPMLNIFGATADVLPYAMTYTGITSFGFPFLILTTGGTNLIRGDGSPRYSMMCNLAGAIINTILDPLFIFGFNMGIRGAGLATALSQTISFLLLLSMYLRGKTISKLSVKNIDLKHKETTVRVVQNGFPSLVRQLLGMFGTTFLNIGARPYGDAAIAAMTIDGRVSMFLFAFVLGIGQGYQPVAAYNHGAGREDRVREGYWFTLISSEVVVGILAVLAIIFAEPIVQFFRDDPEVVRIGAGAMKFFGIAAFFQPVAVCTNMMFQSIGNARVATFLSSLPCIQNGSR